MTQALVTGAGGFIGGHLCRALLELGYEVRAVDIKHSHEWFQDHEDCDNWYDFDLREYSYCYDACSGIDLVFNLAADMGGIGYIGTVTASISRNNILISSHMLEAARECGVSKFFYSSSACVYPGYKQNNYETVYLKEGDVYPYDPEPGYGWEKLFTEQLCNYYRTDFGLKTYTARFHNVYGPYGTYDGGREKAPAALCRKIAKADDGDTIEIWGDGRQTRSFLYVDDCVEGVLRLVASDFHEPLNIGSDRLVNMTEMADIICKIAGKKLEYVYSIIKPQGVRNRCSDNTLVKKVLDWEPAFSLELGLTRTYDWINAEVHCVK